MSAPAVFHCEDVVFSYAGNAPALAGVSLDVSTGERLALMGANGSGKSTLLKLLDGLLFAQAGSVSAFGESLTEGKLEKGGFAEAFRSRVTFVFQDSELQLFCPTVAEEVMFGPLQMDMSHEDAAKRAQDVLSMLGIAHLSKRAPHKLSGGEKKKVAIAAALATNPAVLLLDEPTNNLDPRSQAWLMDTLAELSAAGKTIILSTQDLRLAEEFAARVVILSEEHVIAVDGPAAAVLGDRELLARVNLIHAHPHKHGAGEHRHEHLAFARHEHQEQGARSKK